MHENYEYWSLFNPFNYLVERNELAEWTKHPADIDGTEMWSLNMEIQLATSYTIRLLYSVYIYGCAAVGHVMMAANILGRTHPHTHTTRTHVHTQARSHTHTYIYIYIKKCVTPTGKWT